MASVNNSIRVAAELVCAMGFYDAAEAVPRGLSLSARYGAGESCRVGRGPSAAQLVN